MSTKLNRHRRNRQAARQRELREKSRRGLRDGVPADDEKVVAHDPPHVHGCLRCFIARMEESR